MENWCFPCVLGSAVVTTRRCLAGLTNTYWPEGIVDNKLTVEIRNACLLFF